MYSNERRPPQPIFSPPGNASQGPQPVPSGQALSQGQAAMVQAGGGGAMFAGGAQPGGQAMYASGAQYGGTTYGGQVAQPGTVVTGVPVGYPGGVAPGAGDGMQPEMRMVALGPDGMPLPVGSTFVGPDGRHYVVGPDGTPVPGRLAPMACGCGLGWTCFIIGFLLPFAWLVGSFATRECPRAHPLRPSPPRPRAGVCTRRVTRASMTPLPLSPLPAVCTRDRRERAGSLACSAAMLIVLIVIISVT